MNQGLVDEIMLFVVPVMLKEGIPLFENIENEVTFRLIESRSYATGLVKLHYEVAKSTGSS